MPHSISWQLLNLNHLSAQAASNLSTQLASTDFSDLENAAPSLSASELAAIEKQVRGGRGGCWGGGGGSSLTTPLSERDEK